MLFWLLLRGESPLEIYALYVWTGLLGSLAVLQFWMVLGDLYTLGEAKRLYSRVWTGSLLGATAGAATARMLAERGPASTLVLAAAVVLAVTALGPALALGRAARHSVARPRVAASLGEGLTVLRRDAYVRGLAVLVLVSTIALTLADYVFKSTVARSIPPEELGAFFGGFYTDTKADVWTFAPRAKFAFDAFGRGHDVVVGLDIDRWGYATPFGHLALYDATTLAGLLHRAGMRIRSRLARVAVEGPFGRAAKRACAAGFPDVLSELCVVAGPEAG